MSSVNFFPTGKDLLEVFILSAYYSLLIRKKLNERTLFILLSLVTLKI